MQNQITKIDNELWESNCIIPISKEYPIGGLNGRTIGGANPEFIRILQDSCIYIPIFV